MQVYLYPHGLTPPLKNVRRSRFRKILKKKYIESPDVENEVKALLKSDLYATSLPTYQLVDDNHSNSTTATEAAKGVCNAISFILLSGRIIIIKLIISMSYVVLAFSKKMDITCLSKNFPSYFSNEFSIRFF